MRILASFLGVFVGGLLSVACIGVNGSGSTGSGGGSAGSGTGGALPVDGGAGGGAGGAAPDGAACALGQFCTDINGKPGRCAGDGSCCFGCVDQMGACLPGDADVACGGHGLFCASCQASQSCDPASTTCRDTCPPTSKDGDPCPSGQGTCKGGFCYPCLTNADCDDGNPCTLDYCYANTIGCAHDEDTSDPPCDVGGQTGRCSKSVCIPF